MMNLITRFVTTWLLPPPPDLRPNADLDRQSFADLPHDDRLREIDGALLAVASAVIADPDVPEVGDDRWLVDTFLDRLAGTHARLDDFDDADTSQVMAAFVQAVPSDYWALIADHFAEDEFLAPIKVLTTPPGMSGRPDRCADLFTGLNHFYSLRWVRVPQPECRMINAQGLVGSAEHDPKIELLGPLAEPVTVHACLHVEVYVARAADGTQPFVHPDCEVRLYDADRRLCFMIPMPHADDVAPRAAAGTMSAEGHAGRILHTLQLQLASAIDKGDVDRAHRVVDAILAPANLFSPEQRVRALQMHDVPGDSNALSRAYEAALDGRRGMFRGCLARILKSNLTAQQKIQICAEIPGEVFQLNSALAEWMKKFFSTRAPEPQRHELLSWLDDHRRLANVEEGSASEAEDE